MSDIIGHKKILNYFDKVVESDNLSHAYIFSGSACLGKKTVARYIAGSILSRDPDKLINHPDYLSVEQELNKKTGKLKKNIDVEQIRNVRNFLSNKSFLGGYKVAIIDNAEKLNTNSANVILKTLEEPKGKTVLFIVTRNYQLLLPTIISRAHVVNFSAVDKKNIHENLLERGESEDFVSQVVKMSGGLPGLALNWAEDKELYDKYKTEVVRFIKLFHRPFCEKLKSVEDIFGDKVDHIAGRQRLIENLNIWQNILRGILHSNNGLIDSKLKLDLNNKKILKIMDKLKEAILQLEHNIHPRLLVEQVLLQMP